MCRDIKSFIKKRGIQSLYHFTHINNLENILQNGLVSLTKLNELELEYTYNDTMRLEGKQDYICTSISYPNYKMFYKYNRKNQSKWCVIELDPKILYEKKCLFCISNAASKSELQREDCHKIGVDALKRLFDNDTENHRNNLPEEYTTNPQAEVLVKGKIEIGYIKSIHFNNMKPNFNLQKFKNYTFWGNSTLFNARGDFENWR